MSDPADLPVIEPEQFLLWKHHPVTKVVRAFLVAYREQVLREHLERFIAGADDPKLEMRAIGVAIFTQDFLDLEFEALLKAYGDHDRKDDGSPAEAGPD